MRDHVIVRVLTAERVPEVPQSSTEASPDLGETFRTEHQQCDQEDEQQVGWLKDVADHPSQLSLSVGPANQLPGHYRTVTRTRLEWPGA